MKKIIFLCLSLFFFLGSKAQNTPASGTVVLGVHLKKIIKNTFLDDEYLAFDIYIKESELIDNNPGLTAEILYPELNLLFISSSDCYYVSVGSQTEKIKTQEKRYFFKILV